VGVSGRHRTMARLWLWSLMMVGGSSKGWNQPGLHQTGTIRRRQARREVTVAQNTVEWRRFVRKRRLGFSSVFAKIPHDSSPMYRGFACRSHATRIWLRHYLQSKFEPSFSWDLVDFLLGKEKSCSAKYSQGRRVRHGLLLATGSHWTMGSGCQGE
jgi:hypothetical protein